MQKLKLGPAWIDDETASRFLTPKIAYDCVQKALIHHHHGETVQPLKQYVRPGGRSNESEKGRLISMPAYIDEKGGALGTKLIAGFPKNIKYGLPRASGLVILNCSFTGQVKAIFDCQTISARRTAATVALSFDHLAPAPGDRRVGILGGGPINQETVRSLLDQDREIDTISIFDPLRERQQKISGLVRELSSSVEVKTPRSPKECVTASNVIIAATTGVKGYIKNDWIPDENCLIIPISLDDCEPEVLLAADKVIVDDFLQSNREEKLLHSLTRSGAFTRDQIYAELGEILAGRKPGREGREKIYVNLMGLAVEDIAVASELFNIIEAYNILKNGSFS